MSFTNPELVSIRKYCGYGVKTPVGLTLDGDYGNLEYRLNAMDDDEEAEVRTTYLANLPALEAGILTAATNMDTQQAAVWTRNPREMQERKALYKDLCRRLCDYIGICPGPGMNGPKIVRC